MVIAMLCMLNSRARMYYLAGQTSFIDTIGGELYWIAVKIWEKAFTKFKTLTYGTITSNKWISTCRKSKTVILTILPHSEVYIFQQEITLGCILFLALYTVT